MTLRRVLIALVLFIVATVGHILWWYSPRLRTAQPDPSTAPGRLLESPELPISLWIPYPHQNFAILEESLGDHSPGGASTQEVLAAITRLAGLPKPSTPGFGPLTFPPANEITLASDDTGERFVLAARVYPGLALFARLAGWSAGNPWLGGGVMSWEGRRVEVRWEGNVWWVGSPGIPTLTKTAPPAGDLPEDPPSSMILMLRQATDPLPSGRYHLRREPGALVLSSQDSSAAEAWNVERFRELDLFLLATGGGRALIDSPPQALAIFGQEGSELPRASLFARSPKLHARSSPRAERWSLPGESLLKLTGRKPRRADAAGWQVESLEDIGLERGVRLAPELGILTDPQVGFVLGLWLDLDGGLREVERIADVLAEIPIISRRHRERWNDSATVLRPLARHWDRLSLAVREHPQGVVLRLESAEYRGSLPGDA